LHRRGLSQQVDPYEMLKNIGLWPKGKGGHPRRDILKLIQGGLEYQLGGQGPELYKPKPKHVVILRDSFQQKHLSNMLSFKNGEDRLA